MSSGKHSKRGSVSDVIQVKIVCGRERDKGIGIVHLSPLSHIDRERDRGVNRT